MAPRPVTATPFFAYPVDVVDVTGAGDTFGGALTWCLSQGQTIEEALDFSVAAASRSVTIHGPRAGRANSEEIRRWLKEERRTRMR